MEWIKSGDELELVRFQELTQLSFEAEQTGLKAFNDAKKGVIKTAPAPLNEKLTREEHDKAKMVVIATDNDGPGYQLLIVEIHHLAYYLLQ